MVMVAVGLGMVGLGMVGPGVDGPGMVGLGVDEAPGVRVLVADITAVAKSVGVWLGSGVFASVGVAVRLLRAGNEAALAGESTLRSIRELSKSRASLFLFLTKYI